jgi:hypothetical protein
MLTVKQLIENLSKFDQDAHVVREHPSYGTAALVQVGKVKQVRARTCGEWLTQDDEYGKRKVVIIE